MNKKICFLFLLLMIFPLTVMAESKSITVKYVEKSNVISYRSIISNQTASVLLNGKKVSFNLNENANGKSLIVIKAAGDAYNWISKKNCEGTYYYVGILDGNLFINDNAISQIKIDNQVIKVYDSNGSIIVNDKNEVAVHNTNIYFSFEDIVELPKSKIQLNINGKGRVIIDGIVYTESTNVEVSDESSIIVVSDTNYIFNNALLNGNDITSVFTNNKGIYSFKGNDLLEINFIESKVEESNELYTINGYVKKNGLPVINATVILHSEEKITKTDSNGFYEFVDVPSGDHELLVLSDEQEALGYVKFNVEKATDTKTVKSVKNSITTISVNADSNELGMDLLINENYSIEIDNVKNAENIKTNAFNPLFIIIPIILVILLIIVILLKKKKENN